VAAGWAGQQGRGYDFIHAAVDDCSRVAYLEVHPDEHAGTVAGFATRALAYYAALGVQVQRVLTDNGSGYRSRVFRAVLAEAGVVHKRTRPYRPESNGKVERPNLTLDREWAYIRPYASNQQRLDALPGWLHDYNHHRPHRALDGRSPMQLLNLPGSHTLAACVYRTGSTPYVRTCGPIKAEMAITLRAWLSAGHRG
jgi:transposase InsO family protein